MRLFEIDNEIGSIIPILRNHLARASRNNSTGEIEYDAFRKMMSNANINFFGGPDSDKTKMIAALQAMVPQLKDVIKDVTSNGTIVLNKTNDNTVVGQKKGPDIDQLAKGNLDVTKNLT